MRETNKKKNNIHEKKANGGIGIDEAYTRDSAYGKGAQQFTKLVFRKWKEEEGAGADRRFEKPTANTHLSKEGGDRRRSGGSAQPFFIAAMYLYALIDTGIPTASGDAQTHALSFRTNVLGVFLLPFLAYSEMRRQRR